MDIATRPSHTAARARELLVLASILGVALWGIFLLDATSGTGRGRISGLPIGTDFAAFYTYARVGHTGTFGLLSSPEAFFAEQTRLVPESSSTRHPPLYPLQVALLLSPLARVGYLPAYALWAIASAIVYLLIVGDMARAGQHLRGWWRQVAALAVASPAFWLLILHGQLSVLSLGSLWLLWRGLASRRRGLAGLGLGVLAFKMSLFAPALAVCLCARQWTVAGAAIAAAATQYAVALPLVGWSGLDAYAQLLAGLARFPDAVAGNPPLMHSLRTFWEGLLPVGIGAVAYAVSAVCVWAGAGAAWRRAATPLQATGILSGAIVVTSPHLYVYDLLLLVPLVIASADLLVAGGGRLGLGKLTVAGYLAPLWGIPVATAGVQATTIALVGWLIAFVVSVEPGVDDTASAQPPERA